MTDTTSKLRALFLTALMVFSVFAGTVALTGSAAAAVAGNADGIQENPVFQGEELTIEPGDYATHQSDDGPQTLSDGDLVVLYRGIIGTDNAEQVAVGEIGDDPTFTSDQMDVEEGYYFIGHAGYQLEDTQFQIVKQDLSASAADTVYGGPNAAADDSNTDLKITSENFFDQFRSGENFKVTVNSTSLNEDELASIFTAGTINGDDAEGPITLTVDDTLSNDYGEKFAMDFEPGNLNLDYGTYNFTIESKTSSASAEVSITFEKKTEEEVGIGQTSYQETAGDIVKFNVTLDGGTTGYVDITGGGLDLTVKATDGNDDGVVTVKLNTYTVTASAAGDNDDEASVVGDPVNHIYSGTFEMEAKPSNNDGTAATDVATLQLSEPFLNGASVYVAPSSGTYDSVSAIKGNVTERSDAALGNDYSDTVIVEVNVGGVFGAYAENEGAGITQSVTEDANYDVNNIGNAHVVTDDANNTVYYVLNDPPNAVEVGDVFDFSYSVESDNNPYWDSDDKATTSFEFVDATATLDVVESPYQVVPEDGAEIRGTASVAPGTTFNVRAIGAGQFLQVAENVEVMKNGTWTATFDFGDKSVGTNFTVSVTSSYGATDVNAVFSETPEWETTQTSQELQQRINQLEMLLNETMMELNETEAMLEQKNETIEQLRTQLNQTGDVSQELLEQKNATIEELQNMLDQKNATIQQLQNQTQQYEQKIAQLQRDLLNKTTKISDLNSEIQQMNVTIQALRANNADLQNQTQQLQNLLEQKNTTISDLRSQVSDLQSQVSNLQSQLEEAQQTTTASGPGFTAVIALIALMGAALLAVRRKQ